MTVLTDKSEVGRTDAALLTEELTEIYSTPTPKGWPEPKKSKWLVFDWSCPLQYSGSNIYTQSLKINPTQAQLVAIFGIKEKIFLF